MIYSKGISWLDDTRIPTTEVLGREQKSSTKYEMLQGGYKDGYWDNTKGLGRFTPNLLVSDDALNDGKIGGGGKMKKTGYRVGGKSETSVGLNGKKDAPDNYGDKGSNSRYYDIDIWFNKLIYGLQ